MLAKFINTNNIKTQSKRTILHRDNIQIINPKEEDFIVDGYKPLIISETPNYDKDTEYLVSFYEENENNIIQKWKIEEIIE